MDPNRTRIRFSLEIPYEAKCFALYGGDDGARTRALCRDRSAFDRNPLRPWAPMANKSTLSH
jgi:hypothetical protein